MSLAMEHMARRWQILPGLAKSGSATTARARWQESTTISQIFLSHAGHVHVIGGQTISSYCRQLTCQRVDDYDIPAIVDGDVLAIRRELWSHRSLKWKRPRWSSVSGFSNFQPALGPKKCSGHTARGRNVEGTVACSDGSGYSRRDVQLFDRPRFATTPNHQSLVIKPFEVIRWLARRK